MVRSYLLAPVKHWLNQLLLILTDSIRKPIMSAISDLQSAVATNTALTAQVVAVLAESSGPDVANAAAAIAANNAALQAAVTPPPAA